MMSVQTILLVLIILVHKILQYFVKCLLSSTVYGVCILFLYGLLPPCQVMLFLFIYLNNLFIFVHCCSRVCIKYIWEDYNVFKDSNLLASSAGLNGFTSSILIRRPTDPLLLELCHRCRMTKWRAFFLHMFITMIFICVPVSVSLYQSTGLLH